MGRLTFRTKDGWVGVNNLEDKTISPTSVAIHKLTDIEDFMESMGIESFEDLKKQIKKLQHDKNRYKRRINKLNKNYNKVINFIQSELEEVEKEITILIGINETGLIEYDNYLCSLLNNIIKITKN